MSLRKRIEVLEERAASEQNRRKLRTVVIQPGFSPIDFERDCLKRRDLLAGHPVKLLQKQIPLLEKNMLFCNSCAYEECAHIGENPFPAKSIDEEICRNEPE